MREILHDSAFAFSVDQTVGLVDYAYQILLIHGAVAFSFSNAA